ncbi:S41 family peptidase [Marinilactibacillus piezotolerans]|uniref:S41 family peptidase n=1 Tax=Marinilactibacillus piezotolerans TaxID=258723 RepID=UPI0009B08CE5|nr:S41 family peptidase [Marinilactibacillus piezotolerans]
MEQEPSHDKKAKKVSLLIYICSMITVLIIGVGGTVLFFETTDQPSPATEEAALVQDSAEETKPELEADLQQVSELYSVLLANYFEEVDPAVLVEGALEGMADALGDPYTEYLDAGQSTSLQQDTQGEFEGIGAEVMKEGEFVLIVSPIEGSPAEEAGLQANDLIKEIDDEPVAELSLQEAVAIIRGPKDSEVELLMQRAGEEFTITITRDSIPVESVNYNLDENDPSIGYVQITNFNSPTYDEVVNAINDLNDQGAEKFIFDVRGNPGGLLNSALQISNIFVEDGQPLMQSQGRGEEPYVYVADESLGSVKFNKPAVLLINEGSASASEILAGAVSESASIPLIGQTTFGKGTIQNVAPLSGEGEIKYTTGKWLTAEGEWINEKGIVPDIESAMPEYQSLLIINSEQTYQLGDVSQEVANLNAVLKALEFKTGESGNVFTENTKTAVEDFQSENDLEVNGIVTRATANALVEALRTLIEENDTQYQEAVNYLQDQ